MGTQGEDNRASHLWVFFFFSPFHKTATLPRWKVSKKRKKLGNSLVCNLVSQEYNLDNRTPHNLWLMAVFSASAGNTTPFFYSRAESEGVEVGVMDECIACLTFMQETRDCLLSQITNLHLFMSHYHNPSLFPCTDTAETPTMMTMNIIWHFGTPLDNVFLFLFFFFFLQVAQLHHTLLAINYLQFLTMLFYMVWNPVVNFQSQFFFVFLFFF